MGPLVSARQREVTERYVGIGREEGYAVVAGGRRPAGEAFARGYYYEPTVFAGVDSGARIAQEEIFGPVLAIIPFDDEEAAVEIANDTPYGLAAYVQTGSPERAARLSRSLRAGAVHINGGAYEYGSPFGGYKASGNGREGGEMGLEDFLETKMVHGLA